MELKTCTERPILNPCSLEGKNYQVDPYIGCEHYCYYCYVLPLAETDWRKQVMFHDDIVGRLEIELANIKPQTIYMGVAYGPLPALRGGMPSDQKGAGTFVGKRFFSQHLNQV